MTRWQEFYLEDKRVLHAPHTLCAERAAQLFAQHHKRTILDLACGTGRDSFYLMDMGFTVIGLDKADSGIVLAGQSTNHEVRHTQFVHGDARNVAFSDSSFQGVYSFGLLHEFTNASWKKDVLSVISETQRILEVDGLLVFAVLAGKPEDGLPHVRLFSRQMMDEAFERFEQISLDMYRDIGCTGSNDYNVWVGVFRNKCKTKSRDRHD